MNIEKIIRAWKAEEDEWEAPELASPVGEALMEEELLEVSGGNTCYITACDMTCPSTCGAGPMTCGVDTACLPPLTVQRAF